MVMLWLEGGQVEVRGACAPPPHPKLPHMDSPPQLTIPDPPPPFLKAPPLSKPLPSLAQENPGPVTLSWCGSPNGSSHRQQTGKEGSGSQGGLLLLKVAQQTALGGALIALSCPSMPAQLPVDRWDL